MENGSRQNARKVSSQLLKEEKEQSRRRAYRMVFASSIIYAALLVSAVISYFAYPEFFTDSELRTQFFRENYQGIVAVIAILSGIVTAAIVTPRTVLSALEMFIPGRVFAAGLSELLSEEKSIPKGSVGKAELGADLPTKISDDPDHLIGNLLKEDKILTPDDLVRHFLLRMQIEQIRLKNNALSNLTWGVLFSIVGLAVLSYPLISPQTVATTDWENFIIGYFPRGSLALLLAVISFFFLRLYASNEYDLKHNKNEITTFESKIIASKLVPILPKGEGALEVCSALANNERNFVLKRGEKTISAEVDTRYNDVRELFRDVAKTVPAVKGQAS